MSRPARDLSEERLALALRYGLTRPKLKKPRLVGKAFLIGSCHRLEFSPDGEHLLAATANGSFLWNVTAARKICRLKGISNPTHFHFASDSSELLMRNEQGQFARFSLPDGRHVLTFRAKHPFRLEGGCCFGPRQSTVLQLAYGGVLLLLDSTTGQVLHQQTLDPSGYDGRVFWRPGRNDLVICQTSGMNSNEQNLSAPCALWRWSWPLDVHPPERIEGYWINLQATQQAGTREVVLHHQLGSRADDSYALDLLDSSTLTPILRIECGGSFHSSPALSRDANQWVFANERAVHVNGRTQSVRLPIRLGKVDFHPNCNLVAITGEVGLVAPLEELPGLVDVLQQYRDHQELKQRGYGRLASFRGRKLPMRAVVFSSAKSWLVQSERIDGLNYRALSEQIELSRDTGIEPLGLALSTAIANASSDTAATLPTPYGERRQLLGSRLKTPGAEYTAAVAVSFSDDAIELWPLKAQDGQPWQFVHDGYSVAAIPPQCSGAALGAAVSRALTWYRAGAG